MQHDAYTRYDLEEIFSTYLWKMTVFLLVLASAVSIFQNLPEGTSFTRKTLTGTLLVFLIFELVLALGARMAALRKRSLLFFGLGVTVVAFGLWKGWFILG